jgi:hypothetical protein
MEELTNQQPATNWTEDQRAELNSLSFELQRLYIARQIVAEKYQIAELNKAIKELNN